MFVITVAFEVEAQFVSEFRTAMMKQAAQSLALEEACRQFDVCFDEDDQQKCFLYEKYDSRAAFDAHLQSEHFKEFDATVSKWLKSKTVESWIQSTPTDENS
jgi:quinol monooxygenase YgiN